MTKRALIYKLLHDAELFEKKPLLITTTRREGKGFDNNLLNKGISVKDIWPSSFTVFVSGTQPVDYLSCGLNLEALSLPAKQVIEATVGPGSVEFLPVSIVNEDAQEPIRQYWILNVLSHIDALDWEHTMWIPDEIPYNKPDAHLDFIKPAFKLQAVESQHMFLLRVRERINAAIYISAALRKNLERAHAVLGMDFMPIKVV
ncbi:MAG TPA: DUF1629 domain-containing protein [Anaerolineales bacterium]|nr:DUF1629 domain-containing protein [Anaerolineales bacterium]